MKNNSVGWNFQQQISGDFSGFSTDVGLLTNGSLLPSSPFVDGQARATSVDRSADGSTVTFKFFPTGFSGVPPTITADVLFIVTNATSFDSNGTLNLVFATGTGAADPAFPGFFEPVATPLPAALPLFATGIGALGLLGWHRKRKAQAAA